MLSSSSFNRLCLLPLLALLWASPASAVPVSFSGHFLGPSDATVDRYESIGISAITGWRAAEMDGALINAFLDEGRGLGFDPNELPGYGVPVIHTASAFPIVERSQLGVIMAEVSIGAGGLDDATVRAALGDLMGAGVLLTGNLGTPQWSDDFTTHKRTEKDKDGNKRTYTEHCARRTTRLTFDVRLINSKTGVIMGSDSIGRVSNVRKCDRRRRNVEANLPDPYSVGSDMIGSLAYETANMIAPYWRAMDFSLERNKTTKDGIKMAKKGGDTIGAALFFREAAQADPYNEWLQYSAAVMLAVKKGFAYGVRNSTGSAPAEQASVSMVISAARIGRDISGSV